MMKKKKRNDVGDEDDVAKVLRTALIAILYIALGWD